MDLINEQDIPFRKVGQQRCKIPGLFNGRAGGHPKVYPHFIGDDTGQRRFSQSGRAVEQHVIQWLTTALCCLDVDLQIPLGLLLPGVVTKRLRPKIVLPRIQRGSSGGDQRRFHFLRKINTHGMSPYPF